MAREREIVCPTRARFFNRAPNKMDRRVDENLQQMSIVDLCGLCA